MVSKQFKLVAVWYQRGIRIGISGRMISILCSNEAANFGSLLSSLAVSGNLFYGWWDFSHKDKIKYGKKAEWAKLALENFESYISEMDHWFTFRFHYQILDSQRKFNEIELNFLRKAKTLTKRLDDKDLDEIFERLKKLTIHVSSSKRKNFSFRHFRIGTPAKG